MVTSAGIQGASEANRTVLLAEKEKSAPCCSLERKREEGGGKRLLDGKAPIKGSPSRGKKKEGGTRLLAAQSCFPRQASYAKKRGRAKVFTRRKKKNKTRSPGEGKGDLQ